MEAKGLGVGSDPKRLQNQAFDLQRVGGVHGFRTRASLSLLSSLSCRSLSLRRNSVASKELWVERVASEDFWVVEGYRDQAPHLWRPLLKPYRMHNPS